MCGAPAVTHIQAYSFLKKSGSSSGGMIFLGPPRPLPGLFGLPAMNQAILPTKIPPVKTIINSHAHFGNLRTFSCGVIAHSTKA